MSEQRDNSNLIEVPASAGGKNKETRKRSKSSRVLVVDDEFPAADFLYRRLAALGYQVSTAQSAKEALDEIEKRLPNVVLLDIAMPEVSGIELLRQLRQKSETQTMPVIMVSALGDTENIVMAIGEGANDYVTKPINMPVLVARMETHLKMAGLVHHLEAQTQILAKLAAFDELTGLYNRRAMIGALEAALKRMRVYRSPLSVLMMDLDHFKNVNDNYGHAAGDAVLREFARRLGVSVRQADIRCRYGGEEFCVLLPETGEEGAQVIAERIRKAVEQLLFPINRDKEIPVTVSIGLATLMPEEELEPAILLENADKALYKAKEEGRNRVALFSGA